MVAVSYGCTNLPPVFGVLLGPPLALAEEHAHGGGDARPRLIQVCSNTMPEEGRRMVGWVGCVLVPPWPPLGPTLQISEILTSTTNTSCCSGTLCNQIRDAKLLY